MPQLDIFSFTSLTLFSSLIIVSLIFLIHTYFLPKISAVVKLRQKLNKLSVKKSEIIFANHDKEIADESLTILLLEISKRIELATKVLKTNNK